METDGCDRNKILEQCLANSNYVAERGFKKNFPEAYEELQSITFPDAFSFKQKLYHYLHNDDNLELGVCPVCGKRCHFTERFKKGYYTYCSSTCKNNSPIEQKKIKMKKLERYGDVNYNNRASAKKTNIKKYGCCVPTQNKDIVEKIKKTKFERYGDENYNNSEKQKTSMRSKTKEEKEIIKKHHSDAYYKKSIEERETIKNKIIASKHNSMQIKNCDILGYDLCGNWICKCTHLDCDKCTEKRYTINPKNYYARKKLDIETCTIMNPVNANASWYENEIVEFIKSIYYGDVVQSCRTVLDGKELDIFIPQKKLAIEFNGVYWHSDLYKDKSYHYEKSMSCADKGIQLLHIWEDDWNTKQEIIKDIIKCKLNKHSCKINARNCDVKIIDTKTAKQFCEKYHIQGYTNSLVKLGLFENGNLVMVALFGYGRKISGSGKKEGVWELYRMCSLFDFIVRGGASKLLKHFINLYNPKEIITFADMSISNGNVYEKIGFKKEYICKPTYYWCIGNKRYPRYRFQKSNLVECKENPDLTEDEVMRARGYFKCWDSGKIKYVYGN